MAWRMEGSATGFNGGCVATPGFRFYPTEEELLGFYLRHCLAGTRLVDLQRVIPAVDVYAHHPSDLPSMAGKASGCDTEQWFFFCPRADREAHGGRPARTTPSGYWKATGSPSLVFSSSPAGKVIGVRRTMVFYQGRAPAGTKTRWKMNEYKAVTDDTAIATEPTACVQLRNELSVCRLYISTGTVRSFDRRPENPHQTTPPPSAMATPPDSNCINTVTDAGSRLQTDGASLDDASEDAGSVDWNALITMADVFSFGVDGFNSGAINYS